MNFIAHTGTGIGMGKQCWTDNPARGSCQI